MTDSTTSGSWDPSSGTSTGAQRPDDATLRRFVAIAQRGALDRLDGELDAETRARAGMMTLPESEWREILGDYSESELLDLMRFFTCAEMQLPGWRAGEKSPVIAINRILKSRGCKPGREMLQWIRANSDNRFLPNGPVG